MMPEIVPMMSMRVPMMPKRDLMIPMMKEALWKH